VTASAITATTARQSANADQHDFDGDGLGDACDRDESTPGCVKAIGQLQSNPAAGFALRVSYRSGADSPLGGFAYGDRAGGRFLTSMRITRLWIAGKTATISGVGRTNRNQTVEYELELADNSRNGLLDTFTIRWPGYTATGTLKAGNNEVPCDQNND
jgi:hypothetical protein